MPPEQTKDSPGESDQDSQRIAKLLARAGVASRREVERMIEERRIAIDGVAVETPATILTSLAGVTVDGNPVAAAEPPRLFLYHKPAGLLVTERDPGGRPTIYDRLPKFLPRVMPVGRLDLNTEGLLLLTTDGGLKRQLELPATGVGRTYRARAYGSVTQAALEDLIEGVEIEGVRYGSIDANLERRTGANVWIEMTLKEGKNREVRRVLEHLGLRVSRLIRTRYGPLVLGDLPPGEVGEVHSRDLVAFQANPTRPPPKLRERTAPDRLPEIRVPRPAAGRSTPATSSPRPAPRPSPAGRAREPREAWQKGEGDARPSTAAPARSHRSDRPQTNRGERPDRAAPAKSYRSDRPQPRRDERDERAAPAKTFRSDRPQARRDERPDAAPAAKGFRSGRPPQRRDGSAPVGDARPPRPGQGRDVVKPARAARAAAHRDTLEPRPPRPAPTDKPRKGPSGGRGKPSKPARPTRTRK